MFLLFCMDVLAAFPCRDDEATDRRVSALRAGHAGGSLRSGLRPSRRDDIASLVGERRGAAIAQISGEVDRVIALDGMSREEAVERAKAEATSRATAAGADLATNEIVDVEDVPLAYLPGNATRIRVKAVGELVSGYNGIVSFPLAGFREQHPRNDLVGTVSSTFQGSAGRKTFKTLLDSLLPFGAGEAPADSRNEIDEYCSNLQDSLDNQRYELSPLRGEMSLAKSHGVPRFIPFPTFRDQCVYHHCIFQLEKADQFIHRVSNTFGGWHLPHPHREHETAEVNRLESSFSENYLESPYWNPVVNPVRYRRIWKEYGYCIYLNSMDLPSYAAVQIDIANFYDSIDLPRLERLVRARANHEEIQPAVDLLFHFLRSYDRRPLGYSTRAVGLPHEELTETSRVLSNLYLVDYDRKMMDYCSNQPAEYRYMRYSDDQTIFVPSIDHVRAVVFKAGEELHRLGLNINAAKVRVFESPDEIDDFWKFSIYNESRLFAEQGDASELCSYYLDRRRSRPDDAWRHDMMRNAIIQSLLNPWKDWEIRQEFISFIVGHPSEIFSFTDFHLSRLYSASNPEQRSRLMAWISDAILAGYPFAKFQLHVAKFLREKHIDADQSGLCDELIANLVHRCRF